MKSKASVQYSSSDRTWETIINDEVLRFPEGKDGKRQAQLTALAHDHPKLYAVIGDISEMHDHNPHLVDQLIKAAQSIIKGYVYRNGRVRAQNSDWVYQTSFEGIPKTWSCDCADFDQGLQRQAGLEDWGGVNTDYGLMCQHTLAQLIADFAGLELSEEPIPF